MSPPPDQDFTYFCLARLLIAQGKLDVHSRMQAVNRGRELGYLG